jgi:hypothetical protein
MLLEQAAFHPSCVSTTVHFFNRTQQLHLNRAQLVPATLPVGQYLLLYLPLLSNFFQALSHTQLPQRLVQPRRLAHTVWAAECPFFKPEI